MEDLAGRVLCELLNRGVEARPLACLSNFPKATARINTHRTINKLGNPSMGVGTVKQAFSSVAMGGAKPGIKPVDKVDAAPQDSVEITSQVTDAKATNAAGRVLRVTELALKIASHLDGQDLFRAFPLTKTMWPIFYEKIFWQKKLAQLGIANIKGAEVGASQLRHVYQHRLRPEGNIEAGNAPLRRTAVAKEKTRDHLLGVRGKEALLVRCNIATGATEIHDLKEQVHKKTEQPFFPDRLFAGGRLCMGWEWDDKVIRKVDDWSLFATLDTAPDEHEESFDHAKRWIASGANRDELLKLDRAQDGTIEVWNSKAAKKLGEMVHPRLKDFVLLAETDQLATASADGHIKVWDLNSRGCTATFDVKGYQYLDTNRQGGLVIRAREDPNMGTRSIYRTLDGNAVPKPLAEKLARAENWITFSDGVVVTENEDWNVGARRMQNHYKILAADGTEQGAFSTHSVWETMPFLDKFIVTVASQGDLKIWSKTGELLLSQELGYHLPRLAAVDNERLIAFQESGSGFDKATVFDFGASKTEVLQASLEAPQTGSSPNHRDSP